MLDGIDQIDWARLTHAYGPADDVPDQIRALRSADPEVQGAALWALYGNIFHQGTRYEATAYAVPFLLELLATPETPERSTLAELLASIAIGYDESWLPDGLPIDVHRADAVGGAELLAATPRPGDVEYEDYADDHLTAEEQDQLYTHIAVTAYDAVRAGVPLFRSLLTEPDPALRTMAAYLLAWFPEDAAGSIPELTDLVLAATEPQDTVVAMTALVALGLLDGTVPAEALRDPRPPVRCAAAIALARLAGSAAGPTVVEELIGWADGTVDARAALRDSDLRLPFLDGDLAGYAGLALRQAGPQHAEATFDALLSRIPSVSGVEALPVVSEALQLAFVDGAVAPNTPFAALDERQCRLVRVLADSPQAWRIGDSTFGNFTMLIRSYGLPDDHPQLRAYSRTEG